MKFKKSISFILCAAITIACLLQDSEVSLATKTKLVTKQLSLSIGSKKNIKLKKKNKKAKYSFKSSAKTICTVNKKGVVKAKQAGSAKITIRQKFNKKTKRIGVVKVTVLTDNQLPVSTITPQPDNNINKTSENNTNTGSSEKNKSDNPASTNEPVNDHATSTPATDIPAATASPKPTPIVYPANHDTPNGFDSKSNGTAYGTLEKKKYYSSVTGKQRNVNIILPPGYDTNEKYPVIYLLHGIGGDENEWLGGNPNEIINNLVAKGLAKKMIIVIPNARAGANDACPSNPYSVEHYKLFDNFINDLRDCLIPYMEENYSVATGRENTAIAGLSMGARESLYIGLNMPETFGYTAAFSPGYGVFAYTANGVSEPGLFTEETFTLPDEWKDNTFLMIVNGISEGGENALGGTCSKALKKNGVNHWFYTTPGAHDFQTWKNGLYNFAKNIFK